MNRLAWLLTAALAVTIAAGSLGWLRDTSPPRPQIGDEDAGMYAGAYLRERFDLAGQTMTRLNIDAATPLDDGSKALVVTATLDTGLTFSYLTVLRFGWYALAKPCGTSAHQCMRALVKVDQGDVR